MNGPTSRGSPSQNRTAASKEWARERVKELLELIVKKTLGNNARLVPEMITDPDQAVGTPPYYVIQLDKNDGIHQLKKITGALSQHIFDINPVSFSIDAMNGRCIVALGNVSPDMGRQADRALQSMSSTRGFP